MTNEKTARQAGEKRGKSSGNSSAESCEPKVKKGRGRPKGSKNKTKEMTAHVSRGQRLSTRQGTTETDEKNNLEETKETGNKD